MPETIYLISCSNRKKPGGGPYSSPAASVADLLDNGLRRRLFDARRVVRAWIREERLVDSEKKEGNRATDPRNSGLTKGPEFEEIEAEGAYLPASERYDGRFFHAVADGPWERAWSEGTRTLILSGLYGLLLPGEPIQNYSCHFADRLDEGGYGLLTHWKPVLTDVLRYIIEKLKVERVVDLLSEETYQEAIDLRQLYTMPDVRWYHRCFLKKAGPEALVNLGRFYQDEVMRGSGSLTDLPRDKFIGRHYFDHPDERILFEKRWKVTSEPVAREGLQSADSTLRKRFFEVWDQLDERTRGFLRTSEYVYERNKDLQGFDFTHVSIGLVKALERWLNSAVVEPLALSHQGLERKRSGLLEASKGRENLLLQEIEEFLAECTRTLARSDVQGVFLQDQFRGLSKERVGSLKVQITRIRKDFRNDWIHKDPMPRPIMDQFRDLAPAVFQQGCALMASRGKRR